MHEHGPMGDSRPGQLGYRMWPTGTARCLLEGSCRSAVDPDGDEQAARLSSEHSSLHTYMLRVLLYSFIPLILLIYLID